MPTQFQNALRALTMENTAEFNRKYGVKGVNRPKVVRVPSQFELAKLALRSESPVEFNERYSVSPKPLGGKRRKTRRGKKSCRKQTRRR
jgi:hypothetical protein